MREQFDIIYNNLTNGNNVDAVGGLLSLGSGNVPDLMDYISYELNQPEKTEKLIKLYFLLLSE